MTPMTTFSDETLMAFADDELDPAQRAAVTAAMRDDPNIELRIARHRALRARVRLAYSAELDVAPPERLLAAARGRTLGPSATVADLAAARASSAARKRIARPRWQPLASGAASLLIGVGVGYFALHRADPLVAKNGGWVAGGVLEAALSNQLGNEPGSGAAVRVRLSFVTKSGDYCRVFSMMNAAAPSGVACRRQDAWQIRVLAQEPAPVETVAGAVPDVAKDSYRMAGSALSPLVLDAVQSQMAGEPLDRDGEINARRRAWRSAAR